MTPAAADVAPGVVDAVDLERAVNALGVEQRVVLLLIDGQGFSHQEAARTTLQGAMNDADRPISGLALLHTPPAGPSFWTDLHLLRLGNEHAEPVAPPRREVTSYEGHRTHADPVSVLRP